MTERARTPPEEREDGDNFALTKGLLIAVRRFFCPSLALSGAARQLSQRESLLEDTEAHQPQRSRDADDLRHTELELLKQDEAEDVDEEARQAGAACLGEVGQLSLISI